jgi:hypothetical protein
MDCGRVCRVDEEDASAGLLDVRRISVIASATAVGLVQQRRPGHGEPGEVADHGLEVQQRLEPALRDLRLVRRVAVYQAGLSRTLR